MPDHTRHTLGELLAHNNTIIARNAMSILKQLQKETTLFCRIHYDAHINVHKLTGQKICADCAFAKYNTVPPTRH